MDSSSWIKSDGKCDSKCDGKCDSKCDSKCLNAPTDPILNPMRLILSVETEFD